MLMLRSIYSRVRKAAEALVPAEWASLAEVAREMRNFRSPDSGERERNRLTTTLMFAVGAIPSALSATAIQSFSEGALVAIVGGLLAFFGLLIGFLVTLMLFTGRLGSTSSLSIEDLRRYGARLRYLLASQSVTLGCAMLSAVLCLVYLIVFLSGAPLILHSLVLALLGGGVALSFLRAALLPIQIFELHDAHLSDELAAKCEENDKRYRGQATDQH